MRLWPRKVEKPSRTRVWVSTLVCLDMMAAWTWYRTEASDGYEVDQPASGVAART